MPHPRSARPSRRSVLAGAAASAILAAIHFAWKVKVFTGDPVLYAGAVTILGRDITGPRIGAAATLAPSRE